MVIGNGYLRLMVGNGYLRLIDSDWYRVTRLIGNVFLD